MDNKTEMENRVLARRGARQLSEEETKDVKGGLRSITISGRFTTDDGDCEGLGC